MLSDVIITPSELEERTRSDSLVILDCRFALGDPGLGLRQYEAGHIPGAVHVDLEKDLSGPPQAHGGRHPLPPMAAWTERLARLGVNGGDLVVAYDDSRFAFAARAWWMVRAVGHENVRVLDGGYSGWKALGLPITTDVPTPRPGNLVYRPRSGITVDREQVMSAAESPIVDAREVKRYRGDEEPIDPVAGHIPGASCRPWQELSEPDGGAISDEANRARWVGLNAGKRPIVYCGSGVTACVNLMSLHAAGIHDARLYPGSWSDWCSYADSPIATGDEPRR